MFSLLFGLVLTSVMASVTCEGQDPRITYNPKFTSEGRDIVSRAGISDHNDMIASALGYIIEQNPQWTPKERAEFEGMVHNKDALLAQLKQYIDSEKFKNRPNLDEDHFVDEQKRVRDSEVPTVHMNERQDIADQIAHNQATRTEAPPSVTTGVPSILDRQDIVSAVNAARKKNSERGLMDMEYDPVYTDKGRKILEKLRIDDEEGRIAAAVGYILQQNPDWSDKDITKFEQAVKNKGELLKQLRDYFKTDMYQNRPSLDDAHFDEVQKEVQESKIPTVEMKDRQDILDSIKMTKKQMKDLKLPLEPKIKSLKDRNDIMALIMEARKKNEKSQKPKPVKVENGKHQKSTTGVVESILMKSAEDMHTPATVSTPAA